MKANNSAKWLNKDRDRSVNPEIDDFGHYTMKAVLLATALTLLPLPALAQSWMYITALSDGSAVSIDMDSVRRTVRSPDRVSFKIQINGVGGTSNASMSGNCRTGSWRVSSGRKGGATATIADSTGDQLLERACVLPYTIPTPRVR